MEDTTVDAGNVMASTAMQQAIYHGPTSSLPAETLRQIHITGIVSLSTSIIISALVIGYMAKKHGSIFKRPIGERLVFYLAIADLCFSISHLTDHAYLLAVINNPPDVVCRILGFFMTSFFNSPCVVVTCTALNAFVMVVLQKKVNFGKYDWRLLVAAFVCPQVVMFIAACCGWLGPNGVWCGFSVENVPGQVLAQINAILNIIVFVVCSLCYIFTAYKIRTVASKKKSASALKYHRSARVMMIFVISFVLQYWAITLYYSWEFIESAPLPLIFLTVSFTNQGGLFNFLAYTYVRMKYQAVRQGGDAMGKQTVFEQSVAPGKMASLSTGKTTIVSSEKGTCTVLDQESGKS